MFNNLKDTNTTITTTLYGKQLILKDLHQYVGPLTMQYLPNGGIQMIMNNQIIIKTNKGFLVTNNIEYDNNHIEVDQLLEKYPYLVNTVLPN